MRVNIKATLQLNLLLMQWYYTDAMLYNCMQWYTMVCNGIQWYTDAIESPPDVMVLYSAPTLLDARCSLLL